MRYNLYKSLFLLVAATSLSVFVAAADDPYGLKGKTHSAVTPAPRTDADWWMPRHEQIVKRAAEGSVDLIFLGDSITHGWESKGRELWDRFYAPRRAMNMGFSGDKTEQVLWRLEHGEADGIRPKLAVIMIGTNNRNPAGEIADGIKAIVQELRTRLPDTKILILGIFPRGCYEDRSKPEVLQSGTNALWTAGREASEMVSKIADHQMIYYLDISPAFLKDGMVLRQYMPDFLHPNAEGYQVWADAMEPVLKELLGEK